MREGNRCAGDPGGSENAARRGSQTPPQPCTLCKGTQGPGALERRDGAASRVQLVPGIPIRPSPGVGVGEAPVGKPAPRASRVPAVRTFTITM